MAPARLGVAARVGHRVRVGAGGGGRAAVLGPIGEAIWHHLVDPGRGIVAGQRVQPVDVDVDPRPEGPLVDRLSGGALWLDLTQLTAAAAGGEHEKGEHERMAKQIQAGREEGGRGNLIGTG